MQSRQLCWRKSLLTKFVFCRCDSCTISCQFFCRVLSGTYVCRHDRRTICATACLNDLSVICFVLDDSSEDRYLYSAGSFPHGTSNCQENWNDRAQDKSVSFSGTKLLFLHYSGVVGEDTAHLVAAACPKWYNVFSVPVGIWKKQTNKNTNKYVFWTAWLSRQKCGTGLAITFGWFHAASP